MKKILLFLFAAVLTQEGIAQCTSAPDGQFPLTNFVPNCVGSPMAIDPFCTTSNYSLVTINSGSYQFSSSVATDYITITNSAGNVVLAHGISPVMYASSGNMDVRFYTHSNAVCGNDPASRTRFVQCGTLPTIIPDCALIMNPISGSVDVPISPGVLLSWFPISTNAQAYKVFLGTSLSNATMIANVTQTQINLTDLMPSTTYYAYVIPYNIVGDAFGCESIFYSSFTTEDVETLNCASAINISACGNAEVANFSATPGIFNPVNNNCGFNTLGQELLYSFTPTTSGNYELNITSTSGGFVNYFFKDASAGDCSNYGWSCIGSVGSPGNVFIGFLNAGTPYYILLDKEFATAGSQTFSIVCPATAPANNEASGAIPITVNAGCTGAPYTNVNAFQSIDEPIPSCSNGGFATVWYSFTAPASGAVRVSTDLGSGNTNFDTRVALYGATNPADYSSFELISCDEDGGSVVGFGLMSVLYATGLTPGNTYYIQVGNNDNSGEGTFCLAVDELNSSMLATANSCTSDFQVPFGSNMNYTGWVPLLDGDSKLIALVKSTTGAAVENYTIAQNIHSGAVRFSNDLGTYYLNRSFRITNPIVTSAEVQLFYLNSELTALQTQVPAAGIASLGIAKQSEIVSGCHPNLSATNGAITELNQTGSGMVNNVG